ncbi:MAG TPA: DUF1634 domain-containing protein [Vicinamibacterales bacterium]|jgi:uncharacterized membrane protein
MSDLGLEVLIGRVLRIGVTASSVCLAAGLGLSLVLPGAGLTLLNIGILLLIATPAARVVLSIVEYVMARDWPFTLLTTIVLMELVAGAVAAVLFHKKL